MDTGNWQYVSPQAKDLVCQMLCVEPTARISMVGILSHPWIIHKDMLPQNQLAVSDRKIKGNENNFNDLYINMLCRFAKSTCLRKFVLESII